TFHLHSSRKDAAVKLGRTTLDRSIIYQVGKVCANYAIRMAIRLAFFGLSFGCLFLCLSLSDKKRLYQTGCLYTTEISVFTATGYFLRAIFCAPFTSRWISVLRTEQVNFLPFA